MRRCRGKKRKGKLRRDSELRSSVWATRGEQRSVIHVQNGVFDETGSVSSATSVTHVRESPSNHPRISAAVTGCSLGDCVFYICVLVICECTCVISGANVHRFFVS